LKDLPALTAGLFLLNETACYQEWGGGAVGDWGGQDRPGTGGRREISGEKAKKTEKNAKKQKKTDKT
jgi:hypothetical protein